MIYVMGTHTFQISVYNDRFELMEIGDSRSNLHELYVAHDQRRNPSPNRNVREKQKQDEYSKQGKSREDIPTSIDQR